MHRRRDFGRLGGDIDTGRGPGRRGSGGAASAACRASDESVAGTVRAATSSAGEDGAAAELAASSAAGARWTAGFAVTLEAASMSRPASGWVSVGRAAVVGGASAAGRGAVADGVWGEWLGTSRVEKASAPVVVGGAASALGGAGSTGVRLALARTRANWSANARSGVAEDSACVSGGRSVWGRDGFAVGSASASGARRASMRVTVGTEASAD